MYVYPVLKEISTSLEMDMQDESNIKSLRCD